MTIVERLLETTLLFGQLQRQLDPLNTRTATRQLRDLGAHAIINGEMFDEVSHALNIL